MCRFVEHVEAGDAILILGIILQELLDGVRTRRDFDRLLEAMKPFPLVGLTRETYIQAARLKDHCRRKGVQATRADFLIAAAGIENGYPLLTADRDFARISRHSELILLD